MSDLSSHLNRISDCRHGIPEGAQRVACTRDGRFRIRFPLPPARAELKHPAGSHARVIHREMNRWLNEGHPVCCPITGTVLKIYRRGLHQSQVAALRRLRERLQSQPHLCWIHIAQFAARRDGEFSKLAHWELIEAMPRDEEPRSPDEAPPEYRGWWRITQRGEDWLDHRLRIPRQVALLRGERLGYVDDDDRIAPEDVPDRAAQARYVCGSDGWPERRGPVLLEEREPTTTA